MQLVLFIIYILEIITAYLHMVVQLNNLVSDYFQLVAWLLM